MTGPRYADRFLPRPRDGAPDPTDTRRPEPDELGGRVVRDGIGGGPRRSLPPWLVRVGAGVGVVGAAVVAVSLGSDEPDEPVAAPEVSQEPEQTAIPYREAVPPPPPVMAAIEVGGVGAELWASRGFSYDLALENPTTDSFEIIDIGPPVSGTEIAWDRELVLEPGGAATYRIDYLVVNCLAATTSAVPHELRLLVRRGGADGPVELATIETSEPAAVIEAAGDKICGSAGAEGGSSFD